MTDLPNMYGATAYSTTAEDVRMHVDSAPEQWALRLELNYKTGGQVLLIYPVDRPPAEREEQDLMWTLQNAAHEGKFVLRRVEADGTSQDVSPIGPNAPRPRRRR